jgi:hypothetical protein
MCCNSSVPGDQGICNAFCFAETEHCADFSISLHKTAAGLQINLIQGIQTMHDEASCVLPCFGVSDWTFESIHCNPSCFGCSPKLQHFLQRDGPHLG